jgi:hypothetical protein
MRTRLQGANLAHMHASFETVPRRHSPGWGWEVLSADQAALAFPLVLAVDGPILDLAGWRQQVRAWLRHGSTARGRHGIVGLRTGSATIFSAFFFAVHERRLSGRSLCVPKAWLVEVGGPGRAPIATFEAVEQLARRCDCRTIAIELAVTEGPAREIARALHRVDHDRVEPSFAWPTRAAAAGRASVLPLRRPQPG